MPGLFSQTIARSAANTTTEISYSTGAAYTLTTGYQVPGGFFVQGMIIELRAYGTWADAAVPGTLRHRLKCSDGSVSKDLADTGANVATAIAGTNYWESRFSILCQTPGVGGLFIGQGYVMHGLTATTVQIWPTVGAAAGFDSTQHIYLELTTQWGTANPSNVFQWNAFFIGTVAQPVS